MVDVGVDVQAVVAHLRRRFGLGIAAIGAELAVGRAAAVGVAGGRNVGCAAVALLATDHIAIPTDGRAHAGRRVETLQGELEVRLRYLAFSVENRDFVDAASSEAEVQGGAVGRLPGRVASAVTGYVLHANRGDTVARQAELTGR